MMIRGRTTIQSRRVLNGSWKRLKAPKGKTAAQRVLVMGPESYGMASTLSARVPRRERAKPEVAHKRRAITNLRSGSVNEGRGR